MPQVRFSSFTLTKPAADADHGEANSDGLPSAITLTNPLSVASTYHVHIYNHDYKPDAGIFNHPYTMYKEGWQSAGILTFKGDGVSLEIAGNQVQNTYWDPAKSLLSWASSPGMIPHGNLCFSDERLTALGSISDANGVELTVACTYMAYFSSTVYQDGSSPSSSVPFASVVFDLAPPLTNTARQPVFFFDFKAGQSARFPNGGRETVSDDVDLFVQHGQDYLLNKSSSSVNADAFEMRFDKSFNNFSGYYSKGEELMKNVWSGSRAPIPAGAIPISPNLSNNSIFGKKESNSFAPQGLPPPASVLSVQDLMRLTSIQITKAADGTHIVKDYAQEKASESVQRILLNSLPENIRTSLFSGGIPSASSEEEQIKSRNYKFYELASVAYLSLFLYNSSSVDQDLKNHINVDRLNLFWDAVGAFQIPTNKSDPVSAYGWDRNSNYFKDIQFAYAQQNVDTYRLGYCLGVPAFKPYLDDPKNWHDRLSAHLTSRGFLARWATMNSTTGYTDGYRQLYEWQTQLSCLEDRVKARGQQVNLRTDDVLARLSSAILVPSFNSVNWTDKMKQTFTLQSQFLLSRTQEELGKIMQYNQLEFDNILALKSGVDVYGSINDMMDSMDATFNKIKEHYSKTHGMQMTANDCYRIYLLYREAFLDIGDDYNSEAFKKKIGDGYVQALAKDLSPFVEKWRKWKKDSDVLFKSPGFASFLYMAGIGSTVEVLTGDATAAGGEGASQLNNIVFEFSSATTSPEAANKLSLWLQGKLLNVNGISKTLDHVSEDARNVSPNSGLVPLLGHDSANILIQRFGPAVSVVALARSLEFMSAAIKDGRRLDESFKQMNLNLILALLNNAGLIYFALVIETRKVIHAGLEEFLSRYGVTLLKLGSVVPAVLPIFLAIKLISKLIEPPNPVKKFIEGLMKDCGFYK